MDYSSRIPGLARILALGLVAACTPRSGFPDDGQGVDTDGSDTDGSDTGDPPFDLFECDLVPSCEVLCAHLDWGDCSEPSAVTCWGMAAAAGEPTVLEALEAAGGSQSTVESLIVLQGNGRALTQSYVTGDEAFEPPIEPRLEGLQECDVILYPGLAEACEAGSCSWTPYDLAGCEPVEDYTCADIEALVGG